VKRPLAIVGASTRSAAASAVRAGFTPLAADLFADADLRQIATTTRISPYPEGFLDWLRTTEPQAWMYTGALENHPELVDQMAWIAPLLGNPGDVLARIRDPWALARTLQNAGLSFPEIRPSADGLPHDGSWLKKTFQGASGSGVRSLEQGAGSGETEESESIRDVVYQCRVEGVPCAAVYVAVNGNATPLGVTKQLIGEPWLNSQDFQYSGSVGPYPISEAARNTLVRLGDVLAVEFELVGLFGVDFILDGDEVWTVEVNPRYTASVEIVERYSGACAIGAHVEACGEGLPLTERKQSWAPAEWWKASQVHGKAILFAKRDLVIEQAFADATFAEALRTPWPTLADVSVTGTLVEASRPILTLFGEGASMDDVERRLRDRVVQLERELY
jgi:predicted ATP-grasp superfamily ATP-dependent carboligase